MAEFLLVPIGRDEFISKKSIDGRLYANGSDIDVPSQEVEATNGNRSNVYLIFASKTVNCK
jgi:hypothetical protein